MIARSNSWSIVDEKQKELRELVNDAWDNGEWHPALSGENLLRIIEKSKIQSTKLRQQTEQLIKTLNNVYLHQV